jgi:hypothetical protein
MTGIPGRELERVDPQGCLILDRLFYRIILFLVEIKVSYFSTALQIDMRKYDPWINLNCMWTSANVKYDPWINLNWMWTSGSKRKEGWLYNVCCDIYFFFPERCILLVYVSALFGAYVAVQCLLWYLLFFSWAVHSVGLHLRSFWCIRIICLVNLTHWFYNV